MKHHNHVVGDDLDDHYLKGKPDHLPVFIVTIIVITVVVCLLTGVI